MTDTDRLYYSDARLLDFTARVVELADDGRRVYLDRSAFYPTSGGQPHDVGTIDGVTVVDVVDEGARVAHLLAAPLAAASREVTGRVDAARRRDHMQQHTGQHLVSAVLHERYEWPTLSVHFGVDASTVDVGAPLDAVTAERLAEAERACNQVVMEDRAVAVSFQAATEAEGLRKAVEREGTLRIVTIEDLDRSACGGTHVRATGEIGPILLRRVERVKQGTRIEFLCGDRAVARARRDYEALATVARSMSVALDDVPTTVAALQEQVRDADKRRRALEAEQAAQQARTLYDGTPLDATGVRRALDRRSVASDSLKEAGEVLRAKALAYVLHARAVFVGVVESDDRRGQAAVLVACSDDSGVDAGACLRDTLAAVGGRGGGSSRLAQGSVPCERVELVLRSLNVLT
ncbi:MAG TPA: alanyl-tRNA editing protein [Gemmatimonadaceae bacterium]|nr:alanyl-tRNA editing protein [Gemmatimonadaceae bacterium]